LLVLPAAAKSKFNIMVGQNVEDLVRLGAHQPGSWSGGRFVRTFDAGFEVGFDRSIGQQTSVMTIVTKKNGNLVPEQAIGKRLNG
jgi:hypothetical protein